MKSNKLIKTVASGALEMPSLTHCGSLRHEVVLPENCVSDVCKSDVEAGPGCSLKIPALISYKEAARYLRISEVYLRRLKAQGRVPYVPVGLRGVRFRLSSLNKWVEEREIK